MAKTDINENIYRAIDTIIDARLQNVNFNSTVLCTIADDSKAASGIFTVDNAGIKFQATSMDKSFKVNDQVYVTVPNNNFDAQKIIIGKKEDFAKLQEQWKDPFSYLDIKYKFDDDSEAIEITPTYHEEQDRNPQSILVKKIILNDNFFNLNWQNNYVNQYNNIADAQQDLLDAGWAKITSSQPEFTDKDKMPFRTILKRSKGTCDSYPNQFFYRIKNFKQDFVPTDNNIECDKYGSQYGYSSSVRATWKEYGQYELDGSGNHCVFNSTAEIDEIRFGQYGNYFDLFYNEKKYQPIQLNGLKNIIITTDIKTNFIQEPDQVIAGTYLLECVLTLEDRDDTTNIKTISLTMSNEQDFLGDSYNYFDFFTQTALFDCSEYQNYILNKIEFKLWQNDNFTGIEEGSKIYVKNPKIYFGLPIQETTVGYKSYKSYFESSHDYYQQLKPSTIAYIDACLKHIPPTDTELLSDGPFEITFSQFETTTDPAPVEGKQYYKWISGQYQPVSSPTSPYPDDWPTKYYEEIFYSVKRYKPKIYQKIIDNGKVQYKDIDCYYDNIRYIDNPEKNLYSWNTNKKLWEFQNENTYSLTQDTSVWKDKNYYTRSGDDYTLVEDPKGNPKIQGYYEREKDFYVCYPAGREITGYIGSIEENNTDESSPPQVGISSIDNNVDVVLAANARNSNILISSKDTDSHISLNTANNRNITINENNDIVINNNGKSSIDLNEDLLLIKNTNNSNDNGIKLSNNPSGKGEISLRLGYDNGQPALTIYIQKTNGEHKTLIINYDNLDRLIN